MDHVDSDEIQCELYLDKLLTVTEEVPIFVRFSDETEHNWSIEVWSQLRKGKICKINSQLFHSIMKKDRFVDFFDHTKSPYKVKQNTVKVICILHNFHKHYIFI